MFPYGWPSNPKGHWKTDFGNFGGSGVEPLVISVDTAIVHLANAFNIKQYCVYNNKRNVLNQDCNIVFGANSSNAIQLTTSDNLGHAMGDPMSKFDVSILINEMRKDLN